MFYPCEDWIPLRDAVSTIDLKLAPIFRKRLEGLECPHRVVQFEC
jgi:hypothetical protein